MTSVKFRKPLQHFHFSSKLPYNKGYCLSETEFMTIWEQHAVKILYHEKLLAISCTSLRKKCMCFLSCWQFCDGLNLSWKSGGGRLFFLLLFSASTSSYVLSYLGITVYIVLYVVKMRVAYVILDLLKFSFPSIVHLALYCG